MRTYVLIGLLGFLALTGNAMAERLYAVEQQADVVYGTGAVVSAADVPGTKALTMDIYRPRGNDRRDKPALLVIHGGAFTGGKPRDLEGMSRYFAERGFVCFTISYRLAGDNPPDRVKAACADAKTAVRWIRAHASEFGVDPLRIGAIGHSAGAITALLTATTRAQEFRGDGPTIPPANHPEQSSALQAAVAVAGAVFEPQYVDASDPPLMFFHGTNDPIVVFKRAEDGKALCDEKGVSCRLLVTPGAGHDPWNERYDGKDNRPEVVAFLRESLLAATGSLPPSDGELLAQNPPAPIVDATVPEKKVAPGATCRLDTGALYGRVHVEPSGTEFAAGTEVRLTAVPDQYNAFLGWAGDTRATETSFVLTMDGPRKVTALFAPKPNAPRFTLTLKSSRGGQIRCTPDLERYLPGTSVLLRPVMEPGYRFAGWTGGVQSQDYPATIELNESTTVGARFERVLQVKDRPIEFKVAGGEQTRRVYAENDDWTVREAFDRPWLTTQLLDGKFQIATESNATPYARTALLVIGSKNGNYAPYQLLVQQAGRSERGQTMVAQPGKAVYRGRAGETGTLAWCIGTSYDPRAGLLEAKPAGGFILGSFSGAALGYLTTDGTSPLMIPDGRDYHVYAEWALPANPEAVSAPTTGEKQSAYFYVGVDSGGFDFTKLRFGVEWKDMGQGKEWVLRAQRDSDQLSAATANGGKIPSRVRVHVWKDCDGDTVLRPGGAIVRGQFSLDGGPWQAFPFSDKRMPEYYPVEGMGHDGGDDRITFKVRGLGTEDLSEIRVEGEDVPGVNGE